MGYSARHYLLAAVIIVRENLSLFLLPVCVFTIAYLPLAAIPADGSGLPGLWMLLSIAGNVTLFVLYPIVYGIFLDIAAGRPRRSWSDILRMDWLNYFLVSIALGAPVFLVARLDPFPTLPFKAPELLVTLVSQWISIYAVPLVFFTQKRITCILLGTKCLMGNLRFNRHLIGLTGAAVVFHYAATQFSAGSATALKGPLGLAVIFVTMGVDMLVFVAAALILQDKFFAPE